MRNTLHTLSLALLFAGTASAQTTYYDPTNTAPGNSAGNTTGYELFDTIGCPGKQLLEPGCDTETQAPAPAQAPATVAAPTPAPATIAVETPTPAPVVAKPATAATDTGKIEAWPFQWMANVLDGVCKQPSNAPAK